MGSMSDEMRNELIKTVVKDCNPRTNFLRPIEIETVRSTKFTTDGHGFERTYHYFWGIRRLLSKRYMRKGRFDFNEKTREASAVKVRVFKPSEIVGRRI